MSKKLFLFWNFESWQNIKIFGADFWTKMAPKPSKSVQANNLEAASKNMVDMGMLAFREIVKEVIQEENDGLWKEIKRAISPYKLALDECNVMWSYLNMKKVWTIWTPV